MKRIRAKHLRAPLLSPFALRPLSQDLNKSHDVMNDLSCVLAGQNSMRVCLPNLNGAVEKLIVAASSGYRSIHHRHVARIGAACFVAR